MTNLAAPQIGQAVIEHGAFAWQNVIVSQGAKPGLSSGAGGERIDFLHGTMSIFSFPALSPKGRGTG
jgi:hypothetical protein